MEAYRHPPDANRQLWDRWTPYHAASPFYDVGRTLPNPTPKLLEK